jgi:hypothetical protein|tara:strand:+ start:92 stop:313 length:222 start_codon:yes stop_codon:yes gene_type:complete
MAELEDYLRDPLSAALIAGALTAGYIHMRGKLNNEPKKELAEFAKPAALNAILVFFIVSNGIGAKEAISTDPF